MAGVRADARRPRVATASLTRWNAPPGPPTRGHRRERRVGGWVSRGSPSAAGGEGGCVGGTIDAGPTKSLQEARTRIRRQIMSWISARETLVAQGSFPFELPILPNFPHRVPHHPRLVGGLPSQHHLASGGEGRWVEASQFSHPHCMTADSPPAQNHKTSREASFAHHLFFKLYFSLFFCATPKKSHTHTLFFN